MLITALQRRLTSPTTERFSVAVGLGLSLAFALLYSGLAVREGFSVHYIVQDDARQQYVLLCTVILIVQFGEGIYQSRIRCWSHYPDRFLGLG